MQEEFQVWLKNLIFGVGPGMASSYRMLGDMRINVASHNEFTRMLAEHGVFGLAAIVLLISMAAHNFRQAASRAQQGMAAAFVVWTFAGMAYMALRLAAPAFLFGLSGAALCADLKEESLAAAEENEAAAVPGLNLPKPSFPRRLSR
jgi:O-antigen ligase